MGMLLRRRYEEHNNVTTTKVLHEEKKVEKATESVKDEKPKTVKRGRPTKQ